jgi:plasmid stabilization system protein ParE
LSQVEWYAQRGLLPIARRFHTAALDAIDSLLAMPDAGPPRATSNPRLAGMCMWPVKGFDEFWVYYVARGDAVTVVPVLHSKRDAGTILEGEDVDEA